MIHDSIAHIARYRIPMAEEICRFLKDPGAAGSGVSEFEIRGRDLFVRPSEYVTRLPEEGLFETHAAYADLQYVLSGVERMQLVPQESLTPSGAYDPLHDISFFRALGDSTDVIVRAGEFTVFFPGEAHRPMCQRGQGPEVVRKLVFKIRMPDL